MDKSDLFQQVIKHIGEYLEMDVSHLTMDSHLVSAIQGLDSLKMFEMILYLEDCFQISFDENVIDKIDTMQALVGYIEAQQTGQLQAG